MNITLPTIARVFAIGSILTISFTLTTGTLLAEDGIGNTIVGGCMDDRFPGDLGCTANDVRVSGVADVGTNTNGVCSSGPDGIVDECDITFAPTCDAGALNAGDDCTGNPNVCLDSHGNSAPMLCGDRCAYPGDTTSFAATFIVELSAQERYDIGLYFGIDGDLGYCENDSNVDCTTDNDCVTAGVGGACVHDGALTGLCSISTLPEVGIFSRPDMTSGSFVDLDTTCKGGGCPQPEDLCGDIDNDNNPIYYDLSTTGNYVTATCSDPDANGKLNLPSCTSWRQSGANEVCTSPLDAYPGSPSKCNCDPAFEVPINVPAAELEVVKTASPTSVNEPGGAVTFSVAVTSNSADPNNDVTLNDPDGLIDNIYGDITQVHGDILSTTCDVPKTITAGGTYTCSFSATVSGNGGDSETDIVTASGVDDYGQSISGQDDATVDILDVLPAISVDKTADPTSVTEGAGTLVTFTVVVNNDSSVDPLTLTSLTDDIHGDLNGQGDCLTGGTIATGGSYTCQFTAVVDGEAFTSETDTVTAVGIDDEYVDDTTTPNNKVSDTDSATVDINDDEAMIQLIKTANPTSFNEPSEDITYTFEVSNLSAVDTVTITSLDDSIYGDLNGQGDCSVPQVLAPLASYSCSITVTVEGNGGDSILNVATASGVDDDEQPVMDSDDATVNIDDVPPAASLTKTASSVVATFDVEVTNESAAEALTLDVLVDDVFGDITQVQGNVLYTDCEVDVTIPVGGSYTCTFDGQISSSPHMDTVTGTVSDDESGSVTPSDSATVSFE